MRRVVLVAAFGLGGCLRPVAYPCEADGQCVEAGGVAGTCEEQGYCSFPDPVCASMRRFSELAPASLAGECVEEETTDGTSSSSSSTTIDPAGTSTGGTATGSSSGDSSTTDPIASEGSSGGSSSTGEVVLPDPIGWWPLDEAPGEVVAPDLGLVGADGELIGDPTWTDGHIGGALMLDGVDDRVDIPHQPAHDLESFTIAAWVWVVAPAVLAHPSVLGNGVNYRLRLESMSTRPGAAFLDPDAKEVNTSGSITCGAEEGLPIGQWHHIATAYSLDDRTLRLWVDGVLVCAITSTGGDGRPELANGELYLGYWTGGDGSYFDGLLDDVRLYDVALGQAQIEALAAM